MLLREITALSCRAWSIKTLTSASVRPTHIRCIYHMATTPKRTVFSNKNNNPSDTLSIIALREVSYNEALKKRINEEVKRKQQKVFTIPNILTFSRMAITPVCGYFIWNGMHSQALTCFLFAAVTDLLDGLLARALNQQSDLGTMIDPIADKLLIMTCIISLYNTGCLELWFTKGLVARDLAILAVGILIRYQGFRDRPSLKKFLDMKNHPTLGLDPTLTSKCSTALQCLVIGLILSPLNPTNYTDYDTTVLSLQILVALTASVSVAQYAARLTVGSILKPLKRRF